MTGRSDWLLFVHIAAALVFFGAVLTVAIVGTVASRADDPAVLDRLAGRVRLLLIWPSLVVLVAAGAQLASKEDVYDDGWLNLGMTLTAAVAVLALLEAWLGRRRGARSGPARAAAGLAVVLVVVVFWAMAAKP